MRIDKLHDCFIPAIRIRNGELIIWVFKYRITIYAYRNMGRY